MEDILHLAIEMSDVGVKIIFDDYIHGTKNTEPFLNELLQEVGCYLSRTESKIQSENLFGFKTMLDGGVTKVAAVYPNSIAETMGLSKDDEIAAVNGWKVENNLNDLLQDQTTVVLTIFSTKKQKTITLTATAERFYKKVALKQMEEANALQLQSFHLWAS